MTEIEKSLIDRAQNIVWELRQVASIKFGEYWNIATKAPQQANVLTSLSRTIYYTSESRELTMTYIDTLIRASFEIIRNIYSELSERSERSERREQSEQDDIQSSYRELLTELNLNILNMRVGITNLKGVYHDDEHIKCEIDKKVRLIKTEYENIHRKYND
jgi:hypothetical protein